MLHPAPAPAPGATPPRSEPLVAFVHIPKTAGTTLNRLLERQHPARGLRRAPNAIKDLAYARWRMAELAEAVSEDPSVWAVRGHFPFGFADLLPPDTRYLTFLRDPVQRALSNYYQDQGSRIRSGKRNLLPTPDDLRTVERPILDNLQTRMLSDLEDPFGVPPSDQLLARAKENLGSGFVAFGLVERFDESLLVLNAAFDWPLRAYRRERASAVPVRDGQPRVSATVADLPPASRELIAERNQLDRELYAFAAERFEERLRACAGEELEGDLAVLRRTQELLVVGEPEACTLDERARALLGDLEREELEVAHQRAQRELADLQERYTALKEQLRVRNSLRLRLARRLGR